MLMLLDPGEMILDTVLASVRTLPEGDTHWEIIIITIACFCAQSLQSCPTLCNPVDCSPLSSSAHGILQAGILQWVAVPSPRGSSQPRGETRVSCVSCIAGSLPTEPTAKHHYHYSVQLSCSVVFDSL